MTIVPLLAEISLHSGSTSGGGFIHQLLLVLVICLCASVVYGIGWYFFHNSPPFPPLVLKVWNGFFVLVGGIVIINFLLSLFDHGFIAW